MLSKLRSLGLYFSTFKTWFTPAFARYAGSWMPETKQLLFRDGRQITFRPKSDYTALGEIFIVGGYSSCRKLTGKINTIWDIGGNIGCFVVWASKLFPEASFTSFEPCSDTFSVIQSTRQSNSGIKWNLYNFGLSDRNEVCEAHVPNGRYGQASRFASTGKKVSFPLRSIDEVWNEKGRPSLDLVKIDCEGGEYAILLGCSDDFLRHVRAIVMEVHQVPGQNSDSIRARLVKAGFDVDWITAQQGVVFAVRSGV
jgi:FkbM family methyltransferase